MFTFTKIGIVLGLVSVIGVGAVALGGATLGSFYMKKTETETVKTVDSAKDRVNAALMQASVLDREAMCVLKKENLLLIKVAAEADNKTERAIQEKEEMSSLNTQKVEELEKANTVLEKNNKVLEDKTTALEQQGADQAERLDEYEGVQCALNGKVMSLKAENQSLVLETLSLNGIICQKDEANKELESRRNSELDSFQAAIQRLQTQVGNLTENANDNAASTQALPSIPLWWDDEADGDF